MLSIVINVKNGALYLERCLTSVKKFADVVVLDNFSTDNTIAIAKKFTNVRIFESEFNGMGNVKNLAATYAKNDWVFSLDCDEILEFELVDQLIHYKFQQGNIYLVHRKNYYNNKLIYSSSWGNDWVKRIFNKHDTKFDTSLVHEGLLGNLPQIKIHNASLLHFPYTNVEHLIHKMQFYSTLYAKQKYTFKSVKLWLIPFRTIFTFIKLYILKQGYKQGYEGLLISGFNAIGVFAKYMKLYELANINNTGLVILVDNMNDNQIITLINKLNNQTVLPNTVFFLFKEKDKFIDKYHNIIQEKLMIHFVIVEITAETNQVIYKQFEIYDQLSNIILPLKVDKINNNYISQCKKSMRNNKNNVKHTIIYYKNK